MELDDPALWQRVSPRQRRVEMARRKAELLAESAAGAEDWLVHCDVWGQVEHTTSAFAEILRHFSQPDGATDRTPLLVAVRLARAAEVSRSWRSAADSDVVWRGAAESALRQRFPLLAAMKARAECTASWKELCVRFILASADCDDVVARNTPSFTPSRRSAYLVGLTVEQQRRAPPAASEATVLLSSLVEISEPRSFRTRPRHLLPPRRSFARCLNRWQQPAPLTSK